jgi:hypothetical protein
MFPLLHRDFAMGTPARLDGQKRTALRLCSDISEANDDWWCNLAWIGSIHFYYPIIGWFWIPAIIDQLTSLIQMWYAPSNIALYGKYLSHWKSHDRTMTHVSRISKRCINKVTNLWLAYLMFKSTIRPKAGTATTWSETNENISESLAKFRPWFTFCVKEWQEMTDFSIIQNVIFNFNSRFGTAMGSFEHGRRSLGSVKDIAWGDE